MTSNLKLNTTFFASSHSGDFGITAVTIEKTAALTATAIASVEAKRQAGNYGFIQVLQQTEYLDQTQAVFEQLKWAKTLVVVGIGGSDLGARAIQQALQSEQSPLQVLFHGDSTDPEQLRQLLARLDLSSTVFNIISKSGQTVETISQYIFLKSQLQAQTADWQRHFVFTTDPQEGILRQEAQTHGVATLPIPPSVGGR